MASNNDFHSRLSQLQQFQKSQDHSHIINTLNMPFDLDANDIITKWKSNSTLSSDEKKYIDSYSHVQLSFVKYCFFHANTTTDIQTLIEKIQGRLFQRTQIDALAAAVEFIREQQSNTSNETNEEDIMLVYLMRMIDARSLAYRLLKDIALPPTTLNGELYDCLLHRHAKKYLRDVISTSKTNGNMSINYRHTFFIGCCTFAVALYDENKEKLVNDEPNNKYIYLLAKYIRIMLNKKDFAENNSIHYCLRGVFALLTNCIPREHWLSIINEALANEEDEDAQKRNPFNLDLFSSVVNELLGSDTLQKKTKESGLNDETLLVDAVLVFLVKWSDTQRDLDDDDDEEETSNNNNSASPLDQPNQVLRYFQSHEQFQNTAQIIIPYIDAKYDRLRLMALSILSNIMNNQDFEKLGKQKSHMAKDLIKLIFDFLNQAAKQSDHRYKGIAFDTLLLYLHRLLVQDFIKNETVPYVSQVVSYAKQHHLYALKILRRITTSSDLANTLSNNAELKQFLEQDADIIYGVNAKMYRIIKDIRQNLVPPPEIPKPSVSDSSNDCQAFISYCQKDTVVRESIEKTLMDTKLFTKLWVDKHYMEDNMIETVARAMNESKVIFVLMSDNYCKSDFCRREWTYAINEKIKVYVIVVQEDFNRQNYDWVRFIISADLYYKKHKLEKLIENLGKFLNKKVEYKPKPPSPRSPPPTKSITSTGDGEYLKKTSISTWTSEDIQNWCSDNHLAKWHKPLTNFDGRSLLILRRDLSNDRRIQFISKETTLDLFDIVRFKSEVDKLLSLATTKKKSLASSSLLETTQRKPPTKKPIRKRRTSKVSNK